MISRMLKSITNESTYNNLKEIYKNNITHFKRDIYSEFGEDFIAAVLLGFKRNGTYIDIGAFRPKELSTTYYFYKKLGWSGIIVEPNPLTIKEFFKQRPKDKCINMGVAGEPGKLLYHQFKDPTLNSFDPTVKDKHPNSEYLGNASIDVRPLKDILSDNFSENQEIDLMNVDVEGLDLEVLQSNDWNKFSPKVIIIEDFAFDPENPLKSEIVQFLKSKKYKLKSFCHISLIFKLE